MNGSFPDTIQNEVNYEISNKLLELISCLENVNYKLQQYERTDLNKRLSYLESITVEVQEQLKNIENIKTFTTDFKKTKNIESIPEEKQFTGVEETYRGIQLKIDDLERELKNDLNKDKFYKNLTGVKLVLADSRDWFKQNAGSASQGELEERLKNMESLSHDITDIKTLCTSENSDEWTEWKRDFDQFLDSWTDMKKAIIRLIQERGGYANSEAIEKLLTFIEELNSFCVIYSDLERMNEHLVKLEKFTEEYTSLDDDFSSLSQGNETSEIFELWPKIPNIINDKRIKQTTAIENLHHFNSEYKNIEKILIQIETTFETDIFIIGEIKTLQKKALDYENYASDIKKLEIDIISIKNFSEIIIINSDDTYKEILYQKIQLLNDKQTNLINLYKKNLQKLNQITQQTEDILTRVNQTVLWLNDLEMNTPQNKNADIMNLNELFQIKSKFQTLKETCEQMTVKFRELNEAGSEILLQIDDMIQTKTENKVSYLAKKFTKLNARWNEVTSLVYTKTALLEHISSQIGEFKTLIVSETGYLEKLEKLLRKSPENAADAEEISEELDDLENYIRNHSESRLEKIHEFGKEIINSEFMVSSIEADIKEVTDKWDKLQHQAKQRTTILEQAVSEAQTSESRVSNLQHWIYKVDEILNDYIGSDTTMEDIPHDFQRLIDEFKKNEQILKDMKQQVETYQENGKFEAANRYQEQINLLHVRCI